MFALAEEGHRSLYRQVVACILSVRTYDEVSLVAARRLLAAAPEPADLLGTPRRAGARRPPPPPPRPG
jgi:endonuclease-3